MYYVDAEGHLRQMSELNGHPAEELSSSCDGLRCAPLQTRGYPAEEMLLNPPSFMDELTDEEWEVDQEIDDMLCAPEGYRR